MSDNTYDSGRLNLPFVGHCTFAKQPVCLDWQAIDADVAVLGVPFDMGTQYRPGARFGPQSSVERHGDAARAPGAPDRDRRFEHVVGPECHAVAALQAEAREARPAMR